MRSTPYKYSCILGVFVIKCIDISKGFFLLLIKDIYEPINFLTCIQCKKNKNKENHSFLKWFSVFFSRIPGLNGVNRSKTKYKKPVMAWNGSFLLNKKSRTKWSYIFCRKSPGSIIIDGFVVEIHLGVIYLCMQS